MEKKSNKLLRLSSWKEVAIKMEEKEIKIVLPEKVACIIHKLETAGYQAYAVGGCVRDTILGRIPDDWDITTSATPEQVKSVFLRTVDTGIEHGTVTVLMQGEGFEVTTYRIDGEYEDSRHPKEVTFTPSLVEDLKRRDFTINAMAYNENGLVDLFGGREDLEKKIIRCVGNPQERFSEDALRMMRGIRFSAQLGYEIEQETEEAIRELAPTLEKISVERIQVELVKLVTSPHPDYLRKAYELGITKIIFKEFDVMMEMEQNNIDHYNTVGEHTLQGMCHVEADKILRLSMLFHDVGKIKTKALDLLGNDHFYNHARRGEEITKEVLKNLRFDNETIRKVVALVKYHNILILLDQANVRKAIKKVGEDIMPYLLQIKKADVLAKSNFQRQRKLDYVAALEQLYGKILENNDPVSLKQLAVSGRDLIDLGMPPGKGIGEELERLLEIVLEDPEKNDKELLLSLVILP